MLQAGDPPRERRLAGVEALRRRGEGSLGDHLDEGAQIVGFGQGHDESEATESTYPRPGTPSSGAGLCVTPRQRPAARRAPHG